MSWSCAYAIIEISVVLNLCICLCNIVMKDCKHSAHQMSGDRVTETVQFYVVITYTFVSELSKIMM